METKRAAVLIGQFQGNKKEIPTQVGTDPIGKGTLWRLADGATFLIYMGEKGQNDVYACGHNVTFDADGHGVGSPYNYN